MDEYVDLTFSCKRISDVMKNLYTYSSKYFTLRQILNSKQAESSKNLHWNAHKNSKHSQLPEKHTTSTFVLFFVILHSMYTNLMCVLATTSNKTARKAWKQKSNLCVSWWSMKFDFSFFCDVREEKKSELFFFFHSSIVLLLLFNCFFIATMEYMSKRLSIN